MTPEKSRRYFPAVETWIRVTLAAHAAEARTIACLGFARLPRYFPAEVLRSAKRVVVTRVPMPPLAEIGLARFAEFEHGDFRGVTYLDTFFVRADCADDEALHFHELIHVVQWRALGPEAFLMAYADGLDSFGYRGSPLEDMAYRAQAAFSRGEIFDAEKWVIAQLT